MWIRCLTVFVLFALVCFAPEARASTFTPAPTFTPTLSPDYPLASNDRRVIVGNAIFEEAFKKLDKELEIATEGYARKLRPEIQVIFDECQMDWKVYFETERVAFRPTNVWTRSNPKSKKYENLHQQNLLFAMKFRLEQIKMYKDKIITTPDYNEEEERVLLMEIKEAKYRVNVWTEERMRYRVYRAESAWENYCESARKFARVIGFDQTQITKQDFQLLEYRNALLSRQREALFRIKFEAEEL
ncbi:MAG: hypothetical protein FWF87_04970 [Synergistaceae bacterium]|nr:hypothetical protein [Synergistaceae bacterium]